MRETRFAYLKSHEPTTMGAQKAKKAAFLANHPVCCFCGTAAATTDDHVPARVCFKGRQWPEGYVFPACAECNARHKDAEQVVAFHLHAMTDAERDFAQAYGGLKNNYPKALPDPFMSLAEKAKALSARGITVPFSHLLMAPVVKLSPEVHDYFHRFGRKLAQAFYYKAVGRPTPPGFRIVTHWLVGDTREANETLEGFISFMPTLEVGRRVNVDLGNQFAYRYNVSPEGDWMVQTSNFNDKVFITSLSGRDDRGLDFDRFLTLPSWRETV
jgi:hypothetical protein